MQAPLPCSAALGWDPSMGLRPLAPQGDQCSSDIPLDSQPPHVSAGASPFCVSELLISLYVAASVESSVGYSG